MTDPQLPERVLDTVVRYGPVARPGPSAQQFDARLWADHTTVWFLADEVRIQVAGTDEVLVDADPEAQPGFVASLLYGWATPPEASSPDPPSATANRAPGPGAGCRRVATRCSAAAGR